jgi:hypothetical protein
VHAGLEFQEQGLNAFNGGTAPNPWIATRAPSPAYRGAAVLLTQKSAGYISFVAHTGRDLMNGLASAAAGVKSGRVQYQSHVDKLQSDWQDEWRFSGWKEL